MPHKYAHIEKERRFLLAKLPDDLDQTAYQLIEDVYITGTRLRLRRMSSPDGETRALKLGQKFNELGRAAHETTMTNFYLNEAEYEVLRALPGLKLMKRRYAYVWHGRRYAIDQFLDHLIGLLLAEIEAESEEELMVLPVPEFAMCEVTAVPFFTGGNLVTITEERLREEIRRLRD
jgi:CYTH domain-containing protein